VECVDHVVPGSALVGVGSALGGCSCGGSVAAIVVGEDGEAVSCIFRVEIAIFADVFGVEV
jgi:hypothetical protein